MAVKLAVYAKQFGDVVVEIHRSPTKKKVWGFASVVLVPLGWRVNGFGIMRGSDERPVILWPKITGPRGERGFTLYVLEKSGTHAIPLGSMILETFMEALGANVLGQNPKESGQFPGSIEPPTIAERLRAPGSQETETPSSTENVAPGPAQPAPAPAERKWETQEEYNRRIAREFVALTEEEMYGEG